MEKILHNSTDNEKSSISSSVTKIWWLIIFLFLWYHSQRIIEKTQDTYNSFTLWESVQAQLAKTIKDTTFYYPELQIITEVERKTIEWKNLKSWENWARLHFTEYTHIVLDNIQIKWRKWEGWIVDAVIISKPTVKMHKSFAETWTYYQNVWFSSWEKVITDLIDAINQLSIQGKPLQLPLTPEQQKLIQKQIEKYGVNIEFQND